MNSDKKNKLLCVGYNNDVVKAIISCYNLYKDQTQDHVKYLRSGLDVFEQCKSIFEHLTENVIYKEDNAGEQLIKSPARLLSDGFGDCKSFALYCNSCLHSLGIPHKFRFVNFDGGNQYTHVYAVALDEHNKEIILDAVERGNDGQPIFNYARSYTKKKDFNFYD